MELDRRCHCSRTRYGREYEQRFFSKVANEGSDNTGVGFSLSAIIAVNHRVIAGKESNENHSTVFDKQERTIQFLKQNNGEKTRTYECERHHKQLP